MKVLFVDTYYGRALAHFYKSDPMRALQSSDEQHAGLIALRFGTSDYYSRAFRKLGHESVDVIYNAEPLQLRWALEHGCRPSRRAIFAAQVAHHRPDVVYVHDLLALDADLLRELPAAAPTVRAIVGQAACALPGDLDLGPYDLLLSSLPHFVDWWRTRGVVAEPVALAFDPIVRDEAGASARDVDVAFTGSFTSEHAPATRFFVDVARGVPVALWGPREGAARSEPTLSRAWRGEAWGLDMFRVLARARIGLNRHARFALGHANNMRLFETTGMGAVLVTDRKGDLSRLWDVDREVVAYANAGECVEKLRFLLDHPAELDAIAQRGQARTLRDHTYDRRAEEMEPLLEAALSRAPPARPARPPTATSASNPDRAPERFGSAQSKGSTELSGASIAQSERTIAQAERGVLFMAPNVDAPARRALRRAARVVRRLPGGARAVTSAQRVFARARPQPSHGYRVVDEATAAAVDAGARAAWDDDAVASQQRALVDAEIFEIVRGQPARVYDVAAEAVAALDAGEKSIVEIGCGAANYAEALPMMLGHAVDYVGVDVSRPALLAARRRLPSTRFVTGDALRLPFRDGAFDVAISGCILLHLLAWRRAVDETARVARSGCIFHRTPLRNRGATALMTKKAYGSDVVEICFSEDDLLAAFSAARLSVIRSILVEELSLPLDGGARMVTHVCKKI